MSLIEENIISHYWSKNSTGDQGGEREYGIEVIGVSKSRWKGAGSLKLQSGETVVYVGDDEVHHGGVAIIASMCASLWKFQ